MAISVSSNKWPYSAKEPIDSGAVLNYGIDWTNWLPVGAAIQSAVWNVIGGTAVHSAVVGGVAYVWLSVASGATSVEATVHITLDTSPVALQDERTIILTVKDR